MDAPFGLKHTSLFDLHVELGARMVPFAGYAMPVQYPGGIIAEHLHTRAQAGLFDTSHMGQAMLSGPDPAAALERLTPADLRSLGIGRQRYCLLLNDEGCILDDFMVSRLAGETALRLVVNAATKEADFAYIAERLAGAAELTPLPDRALLALQGPKAEAALARHVPGIAALSFMQATAAAFDGIACIVSRSGYTGEDGFEISVAATEAETVARALFREPEAAPAGLGARDSLRLEAGLCLYGHDMDETVDPAEAGLFWSVGKRRREARDFPAAEKILAEAAAGPRRKRVGLRLEGRAPAREGTEIVAAGRRIGRVTSGGFAPTLGEPVAMGYVETAFAAPGTGVDLMVRGRALPAHVSALPFVPHRYKKS
jgi:aminomethyltransferase